MVSLAPRRCRDLGRPALTALPRKRIGKADNKLDTKPIASLPGTNRTVHEPAPVGYAGGGPPLAASGPFTVRCRPRAPLPGSAVFLLLTPARDSCSCSEAVRR